jgi:hypothetical protein
MSGEQSGMSNFNQDPGGVGTLPHLRPLVETTVQLHAQLAVGRPVEAPGITAKFHDEHAVLTQKISPTTHASVDIFCVGGTWYIRQETQRPSMETEGMGATVREIKTYPLAEHEFATAERAIGRLYDGGEFAASSHDIHVTEPLNDAVCMNLLDALRTVSGEYPLVQPRAPKKGWLRRTLGL